MENSAAIITVNPAFKIEFANTTSEKILKAKPQELLGKKMYELFENNDLDKIKNNLTSSQNDNYTIPAQNLKTIDNTNTKIPVRIIAKKIKNQNNKLLGIIFIFKDISDEKNYTASLRETIKAIEEKDHNIQELLQELQSEKSSSEEKIKQATLEIKEKHTLLLSSINNLNLSFLILDKYKNITFSNKNATTLFPSLQNQQATIQEFVQNELISCNLNQQIDRCLKEKTPIKLFDVQINLNFVKIFISPIILDEKLTPDPIGATIIIEDKTEQYNNESSKEDLFAITAHELRTPLTAIYGYISLIKQLYFNDIPDTQLRAFLNNIGILSKKLSMTVNNFLDSSRLEQNKIQLKKEQCNLTAIINEVIKVMERLALEKNLYIKFNSPTLPIIVQGDQARLRQIMDILINNAIKFTQTGGIYITLEQQTNSTKVKIQDTGIGISQKNQNLLFNKFQQANNNPLTAQEGMGLGLHIAKLLIGKMGGKIQLEKSEINQGSIFSFTILNAKN